MIIPNIENRGFTLIELIIVIVIMGILSAVAIPKYKNIRENAEYNSLMKIVYDSLSSVPGAYKSAVDLEGKKAADIKLNNLITVKGEGWEFSDSQNRYQYHWVGEDVCLDIVLEDNRSMRVGMRCDRVPAGYLRNKCTTKYPKAKSGWAVIERVSF